MNSLSNKWLTGNTLFKNKGQRNYYDFGTGKEIEREAVKKERDAFLEGFNSVGTVKPKEKEIGVFNGNALGITKLPFDTSQEVKIEKLPGYPNKKPLTLVQYAKKETNDPWGSSLGGDLNSNEDKELFISGFTGENKQPQVNTRKSDVLAKSALDYLYSKNNRDKAKDFLANNGFPSLEDSEYNKKYYGVQEENKRMLDLLKEKSTGILNPKLPDDTDRAFLSGFLGKEEEENNYKKKLSSSIRALDELQDAFRGSQFEDKLNPTMPKVSSPPTMANAINRNPNAKNEYKPVGTYDANKEPVITQLSNTKKPTMWFENGDYAAAQQKAKKEQYKKKVSENAEMNGKSVWKTRKASDVIVENAEFIKSAAKRHGVNPAILAACIYTEQANNVTITEDLEDMVQSFLGMDCSVGLGQVRVSTAKKVEDKGLMPTTYDSETRTYAFRNPFTGKSVNWSDTYSRDEEIYYKLKDPETNINYVAAYLAMIQNMWSKEYPVISGDTAILATLYNIGEDGGKNGINDSPTSNDFGDFAKANYPYMQYLLGME